MLSSLERWKDIDGFEGLYQVSDCGAVKSLCKTERKLKPRMCKGYETVCLCKNGVRNYRRINRLVAIAFIPNPENKPEVNHKDGNKRNNTVSNLEWCTASENQRHARSTGLSPLGFNNAVLSKPVDMLSKSGELLRTFPSFKEAERQTGISRRNIYMVCVGKPHYKTAGGYVWKYHLGVKSNEEK